MKYVIDPMALALDENISERDFKIYVNRIILWNQWLEKNPEDVYVLSETSLILSQKKYFPIYDTFDALMKKHKVDYVQANDLNQMISKLLTKSQMLDKCQGKNVTSDFDLSSIKLDDNKNVFTSKESQEEFKALLWNVYCQCKASKLDSETFIVFGNNLVDNVSISVKYDTIEKVKGEDEYVSKEDNAKILCRSSLPELFKDKNSPNDILKKARKIEDITLAMRVAVYQNANLKKVADSLKYDFVIQKSFMQDFNKWHYQADESFQRSLMEATSQTLIDDKNNLRDREDFRTGKGGNNPQKKKVLPEGTWLAWRWKVTESVSYQYWQLNGFQKFANIGEHDYYVCKWED